MVMAGLVDVLAFVGRAEGLDVASQRHDVLEKAARAIELGADDDVALGDAPAPRGGRRRAELAQRAAAERERAVENSQGEGEFSASERSRLYLSEVARLGRDPEFGVLGEAEYSAALRGEVERRRAQQTRRRMEGEEQRRREEDLANRRLEEERRRQRRQNLCWAAFWTALAMAWGAAFAYFGWHSWPEGVFGLAPTWGQVARRLVPAALPGTVAVSAVVVAVGWASYDHARDPDDRLDVAYSLPAIVLALADAALLVYAAILFPLYALIGVATLTTLGVVASRVLRRPW